MNYMKKEGLYLWVNLSWHLQWQVIESLSVYRANHFTVTSLYSSFSCLAVISGPSGTSSALEAENCWRHYLLICPRNSEEHLTIPTHVFSVPSTSRARSKLDLVTIVTTGCLRLAKSCLTKDHPIYLWKKTWPPWVSFNEEHISFLTGAHGYSFRMLAVEAGGVDSG